MRGIPLTTTQVLAWADEHQHRTGELPNITSGQIPGTNETWHNLDAAMRRGCRGLPLTSLSQYLAKHRGYRNKKRLPPATESAENLALMALMDREIRLTRSWATGG
jgi:hypothetical protein